MEYILARRVIQSRSEQQRITTLRLHRALRDMTNPFNDPHFAALYRLTPQLALQVIEEIKPYFPRVSRMDATPVEIRFLAALHFLAQGSYQKPDGRDVVVSLSQASVSRFIDQSTQALNHREVFCKWVKFPNDCEQQQAVQNNFRKFSLPGVLGFVDGTHILIKKPAVHEELFVNRKGQHSLNVQVVCDAECVITSVLAKYPGSTHDAFVWKSSLVREKMQTLSGCWLLGDSGYPCEPWLLTPILNAAEGTKEALYTQRHILARNTVERCFGVLKGRFRCINKNRVLEYAPEKCGRIINACAILHNMCIKNGLTDCEYCDDGSSSNSTVTEPINSHENDTVYQRGLQARAALINRL